MRPELIAQHMGALHAYEQWIVAGIAFGPFVVLGVVIAVVRRRDAVEDEAAADDSQEAAAPPGPPVRNG